MNILFIGIGKMGLPMATHLQNAGHMIKVIDNNPQQMTIAKEKGLTSGNENDYTWA